MNINEKFLLELLESTDFVYFYQSEPDYLYFYPNNLDLDIVIRIPYTYPTTNVNVKFMCSKTNNEILNFLIDSPDEIKSFMELFYQKYENQLNEKLPYLSKD